MCLFHVLTVESVSMQMSHTGSSCTASRDIENPRVGKGRGTKDDSADNTKCVSNDSSSPDSSVRERVLKQVGLTSTTFIGPEFPPKPTTVKPDIEDTLSEFYKELEQLDTPDGNSEKQNAGFVQPPIPPKTFPSKDTQDGSEENFFYTGKYAETDGYQRSSGQKQPWQHWYQNEPYYPRRPRPAAPAQSQWHPPQTLNRPPNPRFHRPPFHRPPPPSAFPSPQNPPPQINPNWSSSGKTNQYQEDFQTFSSFPPPNVCSPPSQDFYGGSPHHFDRDERGLSYDAHSDNGNVGWSRDRKEESCQFGEDYDHRYDPESEQWEHHCGPPANTNAYQSSPVLILMRGLPGSGKSTLARYVFL